MDSFESEFARRLVAKIGEEHKARVGNLTLGKAIDFADYRGKCEYIKALADVTSWCEEIRKELTQPEETTGRHRRGVGAL